MAECRCRRISAALTVGSDNRGQQPPVDGPDVVEPIPRSYAASPSGAVGGFNSVGGESAAEYSSVISRLDAVHRRSPPRPGLQVSGSARSVL
jgi:hypothetical protein